MRLRGMLISLGLVLLVAAVAVALYPGHATIPGARCLAILNTSSGPKRACPGARGGIHRFGVAAILAVPGAFLVAGALLNRRARRTDPQPAP